MNFAMNITRGCDCEAKRMKPIMDDFGIFISTDPVAIDKACYDMAKERGKKFRGYKVFAYAESIGLGTTDYNLIEIDDCMPPHKQKFDKKVERGPAFVG
jgi:uncharacterized Fe-S center protein